MKLRINNSLLSLLSALMLLAGCGSPPPLIRTPDEAQKRFLEICAEEYKYPVVVKPLARTLYIYLPIEHPIFSFRADSRGPSTSKTSKESTAVKYANAYFLDGMFTVEYDVDKTYSYPVAYGYSTPYTEEYTAKQNNLLQALFRAYADLKSDLDNASRPPDFIVLTIADIKTGIKSESLLHLPDLIMAMAQTLPHDEYLKRYINQISGWTEIIGDKEGRHINTQEITWPEFLSRQIVHRIKLKFQYSSLPPSETAREDILAIAKETFLAYPFDDFEGLTLRDLRQNEQLSFEKKELPTAPPPSASAPPGKPASERYKVIGIDLMKEK